MKNADKRKMGIRDLD